MTKEDSVLLDLLRFFFAILVLIHHAEQILVADYLSSFASFGHDAVIFFFILSGFVISFVTSCKERTISEYVVSRIARMYSVAMPSLLLVICLFFIGDLFFPESYSQKFPNTHWFYTISNSLLFLNQTSLPPVYVPTNGPFWSISYEVWYYIIFGAFFFLMGIKKWIAVILLSFIAGIKILILFPIWLAGYFLYKYRFKIKSNNLIGFMLFSSSFLIYFTIRVLNLDDSIVRISTTYIFGNEYIANDTLSFSKRFLSDYVITILFITILSGLFMMSDFYGNLLLFSKSYIKKSASLSFSIYLYHYPLLVFISKIFNNSLIVIIISLLLIILISQYTENKKYILKYNINKFIKKKTLTEL